jgi:hypothetical protein
VSSNHERRLERAEAQLDTLTGPCPRCGYPDQGALDELTPDLLAWMDRVLRAAIVRGSS